MYKRRQDIDTIHKGAISLLKHALGVSFNKLQEQSLDAGP